MKPYLFQQALHFESDTAHIGPADAWSGIEIDAQLIGMIEIAGANRVRVQFDAAQIDDPGEPGRIVHDHFFGGAPGRE